MNAATILLPARLGALCALILSAAAGVNAGNIQIGFTGANLAYDGTTITDAGSPADALASISIEENGLSVAGSPFGAGSTLDLTIPGVTNIALGGDSVLSAAGGALDLVIPGGFSLNLDLSAVNVSYLNLGFVQFTFAGTVGSVDTQNLPASLTIGSSVDVSFSATVTSSTNNGVDLTSFVAFGSGNIEGDTIPEPSTAVLVVAGLLRAGFRRRR